MHSITDWLANSSGVMVYAIVAALVFCEDALFFGFVLPGETAAVLGGVIAGQGRVSILWMCATVVLAAIAGDSVGYEVGRRFGPRILESKALRGHRRRIGQAQDFIRRRGPAAVFLGRFIAFFRALMPALAGISRMPYPKFLLFNALGGLVWGVGFTLLGYFAGAAYKRVEKTAGTAVAVVVAVVVVAAVVVWRVRRHRAESAGEANGGEADGGEAADQDTAARDTTDQATDGQEADGAGGEGGSGEGGRGGADGEERG